jgi:hypothetical protein
MAPFITSADCQMNVRMSVDSSPVGIVVTAIDVPIVRIFFDRQTIVEHKSGSTHSRRRASVLDVRNNASILVVGDRVDKDRTHHWWIRQSGNIGNNTKELCINLC